MAFLALESEPPRSSLQLDLYCMVSTQTFIVGLTPAYSVNISKYKDTTAPLSVPDTRFDVIHIDLIGPLPPSRGFTYLLTCVDRFTRWPEAIPFTSITAEAVAQAFLAGWISCFGVPSPIVTDRGRQFESRLWTHLMSLLGSKRARITAYHPQTNGIAERFHRQLKAALKAQPTPDAWMDTLPLVLLGLRTALKDISATSADMVYGTTLRLPGEFFTPSPTTSLPDPLDFVMQLESHFQSIRPQPPRIAQRNSSIPHNLSNATLQQLLFVRHDGVRKPLQPPYDGPFPIISRTDKHFTIAINGRSDTISIDRLKPNLHPKTLLNHNFILHLLILHPPPLAVLVLDDMFNSLHIYLITCNTLRGVM